MANGDRQSLSSAFDDMLQDGWRELETLYDGPAKPAARAAEPARTPASDGRNRAAESEPERFLNDRYGTGWRQEVLERKRDGDEVVVLAKLVIDDPEIVKTQFGRARVAGAGSATAGTSGGISFAFADSGGTASAGASGETEAYDAAAADALRKCVAIL